MTRINIDDRADAVTRPMFRDAMSRLGAAVHVVTTDGPAGRCGVTVSAVCSVTDDPPTLLVCLNRASAMNSAFKANAVFCVNTMPADAAAVAEVFAGRGEMPMDARFGHARWETLATGSPALAGARASIDCRLAQVSEVGTHSVLFGEVMAQRLGAPGPALMYLNRSYHAL